MRWARVLLLAVLMASAAAARGQEAPLQITSAQAGFPAAGKDEPPRFKLGLWTPISVKLHAGTAIDGAVLAVETADSENVGTVFTIRLPKLQEGAKQSVVTYSRPGNSDGRFTITIRDARSALLASTSISQPPLDLRESLFVTIGAPLPELDEALLALRRPRGESDAQDKSDSWPRRAGHIVDPDRLPDSPLGYDAVDLLILSTSDGKLTDRLNADTSRLGAIAGWVRQGGRLVISVSPGNQAAAARLLESPAWQPPLPVERWEKVPAATSLPRLIKIEEWANITDKPFPAFGEKPVPISWLTSGSRADWRILAETAENRPLMAQFSHGRGQVTLLAFDIDREPFSSWNGRVAFLKALASRLEPRIPQILSEQSAAANEPAARDLATQLQTTLDRFDVSTFRFGWVALLILGYIVIIGPLDYFFLGRVLGRLHWTWISFPLVVLAVSLLVFATIRGVRDDHLRINQVDLVDFDLRTEVDGKFRPVRARAYGNTWFTLLTPRIKSYTLGIQPNVASWFGEQRQKVKPAGADVMTWLGRPEYDGAAAMGRPRAQTLAGQRAYDYVDAARGLSRVPVPVWTTKSLMASWESPLPRLPFHADLQYYTDKELVLSGTIQSMLPADLHDVWLFFGPRAYFLEGPLKGGPEGGAVRAVSFDQRSQEVHGWSRRQPDEPNLIAFPRGPSEPAEIVKEILFHELVDTGHLRNHTFHRLDLSWRLSAPARVRQNMLREAILFGRLASAAGSFDALAGRPGQPLPTLLWIGDMPGPGKTRPAVDGQLYQETYVRAFLPVRPAE